MSSCSSMRISPFAKGFNKARRGGILVSCLQLLWKHPAVLTMAGAPWKAVKTATHRYEILGLDHVHHPIIQSSQEQSSWQSHFTLWLDLEGMKLLVKVPTSGWFPTTFFDLVQKRKDWWRKDLNLRWSESTWMTSKDWRETYQLIGWHHPIFTLKDWMTSFGWKMKVDYDSHLYLPHVIRGTRTWLQPFPHQRRRQVAKAFLQQFMEPRWTAPIVSSATQTWRFSWCTAKWGSAVTSPKSTAPHEGSWKSVGRIVWGVRRCTEFIRNGKWKRQRQ